MSFDPARIFFDMVAFLFAISLHESAHAWTANLCGDPTAKMLGRITLNPLRHIDPFGSILVPLIGMVSGIGFIGWARPTPVDPRNFRRRVADDILVSIAGPASNLLLVIIFALILKIVVQVSPPASLSVEHSPLLYLLLSSLMINVVLMIFNLIPVPPLDGSHVIRHFLSPSALNVYDRVGTYGLLLLFVADMYFHFLGYLFVPAENLVYRFVSG